MPKIQVLSDTLASQVAAGEVVERPASVVKELVENSIDAGAREVCVDIDQGGVGLIRVRDDGCGMSREDARLSLERHATSKLREAADLAAIRTLGFRGEAVPSIASVSRFRMVTREAGAVVGTELLVEGGRLVDLRDAGCAPGTTIEAKALFFNMPARKKFMRAESTESAHVEHQMRLHALAAPQVRFRLRRNEREVFDLPAVDKPVDRVRQLLGPDLAGDLIALPRIEKAGVVVEGFVLPASHARKGRKHQFVMLNGRPVEDAVISRALSEGFRGAVADGLHPAAWLWIGLDPVLVDVNVHPAKREVRFQRPSELKQVILEAVMTGLRPPPRPEPSRFVAPVPQRPGREISEPVPEKPVFEDSIIAADLESARAVLRASQVELGSWQPAPAQVVELPPAVSKVPAFRVLGLLRQRYVVMEGEEGLVLLDPRAARERICYEALIRHDGPLAASQGLLVPVLLELDPRDVEALLREQDAMARAGIEIESFGGNTIQIRSLPACLQMPDLRSWLGGLLDELLHEAVAGAARFAQDRMARLFARRAAAGGSIRIEEVQGLLRDLFACDLPYCTADGRPTLMAFGMGELDRRFGIKS